MGGNLPEKPFTIEKVELESDVYDFSDLESPGPIVLDLYDFEREVVPKTSLRSDSEEIVGELVPESLQWVLDFLSLYYLAIKLLPKGNFSDFLYSFFFWIFFITGDLCTASVMRFLFFFILICATRCSGYL